MAKKYANKKIKPSTIRGIVIACVFVAVLAGCIFHTGTGTLSSFGLDYIASICPLGALEAIFGTWAFVPRALIALAGCIILVILVGRAFCAWICPVPPLKRFVRTDRIKHAEEKESKEASELALERFKHKGCAACKHAAIDSRHLVLGGTLLSTAIFGFPVFCIVCPIGLTFATMLALVHLLQFNEPTFGLLVFPAIILIELLVLRKWCAKICPLGALLSLLSKFNKTFKPAVDTEKCLRNTKGEECTVCSRVCPEHIDPRGNNGLLPVSECTRCNLCAEACPQGAISFPFLQKAKPEEHMIELRAAEQTEDAGDVQEA